MQNMQLQSDDGTPIGARIYVPAVSPQAAVLIGPAMGIGRASCRERVYLCV